MWAGSSSAARIPALTACSIVREPGDGARLLVRRGGDDNLIFRCSTTIAAHVQPSGQSISSPGDQCHLVKPSVPGGVVGLSGSGRGVVGGARVSWWGSCGGCLSWRHAGSCVSGGCSVVRGSRRSRGHGSGVLPRGENAGGWVTCRRTMCNVRVNDSRSGSMSAVSAASTMNALIA